MNKREFVRLREPSWRRFDELVDRLGRRALRKAASGHVNEYSRLFRELANDLATVRSRGWGQDLETYLNQIVARGHGAFYSAPPGGFRQVFEFLAVGFPKLFRANIRYFIVASVLFFGSGAISWVVIQNNPDLANRIIPEAQLQQIQASYSKKRGGWEASKSDKFGEQGTFMTGFYIRNNIGIAFACYARGVLLGIGTVYTLLFNGIFIGAVGGYIIARADPELFLSFVVTHGAFELTAIAISGAGGLMLGHTLLHPGRRTRIEALRERGIDSVKMVAGAGVMLLIAAVIEGFWSPAAIPNAAKY
ncbi:MAG: stage II sporulation protein M, partial [Planctomycetes bacterium]|nr:stage II sporulation protein M [Planctomycetota bacterium]